MIPTMILFGLLLGRWWRPALVAAALAWPLILLASGTLGEASGGDPWALVVGVVGAALLGAVNAAVGIGVHQGLLALFRRLRARRRPGPRRHA